MKVKKEKPSVHSQNRLLPTLGTLSRVHRCRVLMWTCDPSAHLQATLRCLWTRLGWWVWLTRRARPGWRGNPVTSLPSRSSSCREPVASFAVCLVPQSCIFMAFVGDLAAHSDPHMGCQGAIWASRAWRGRMGLVENVHVLEKLPGSSHKPGFMFQTVCSMQLLKGNTVNQGYILIT